MGDKTSFILLAYNEENFIKKTIVDLEKYFKNKDIEIIVSADGSTDSTCDIVKTLTKNHKNITLLESEKRLGKGGGFKNGFKHSTGDVIVFADGDSSASPSEINKLIKYLSYFDVVIGSRGLKDSEVLIGQPVVRKFSSQIFKLLIRVLFNLPFTDTQCGYKVFKRSVLEKIIDSVVCNSWNIDVELLYRIRDMNFSIKEVPIKWANSRKTHFNLFTDAPKMFIDVMKLRFWYLRNKQK